MGGKHATGPGNPYFGQSRRELVESTGRLLEQLREQRPRASQERRDLVQHVDWLLCAHLHHFRGFEMVEWRTQVCGADIVANFMEHYVTEERNLRACVFRAAEEFVRGPIPRLDRWSLDTRASNKSLSQHVYDSPDGLRIALEVLAKLARTAS